MIVPRSVLFSRFYLSLCCSVTPDTGIFTLSLHDALPISPAHPRHRARSDRRGHWSGRGPGVRRLRSEEHTSELQSRGHLVCRLLLEKKNNIAVLSTFELRLRMSRLHEGSPRHKCESLLHS